MSGSRMLVHGRFGLCAMLVALGTCATAQERARERLVGRHCYAVFEAGGGEHAQIAVAEADQLADELYALLEVTPVERSEIVLCPTHADFERQLGGSQPPWIIGIARPEENRVFIKQRPLGSFAKLVRHEIVHLFIGQALGEANAGAPRWLHEGAAKYYAGDWSAGDRAALANAQRGGRLHTIAELADFPEHPEESAVAYAESYVLVEYLISLDPGRGLEPFITHFRDTGDVARAFRRAYGLSPEEVEAAWHRAIEVKTRSVPLIWAAETLIFLLMVVVFGIGFLRVRRRSREIRERMQEEELLERLFGETERRGPSQ